MTAEQIIEVKYERLFCLLFDQMSWENYLILRRMKMDEIDKLPNRSEAGHPGQEA